MYAGSSLDEPLRYTFEDIVLDTGRREATRAGKPVKLPKLSYRMLEALVAVAPQVLTHEHMVERVWQGRIVSAETVTQRVMLLRQALGDDAKEPRYVGLVRGQGYRMLCPVSHESGDSSTRSKSQSNRKPVWNVRLVAAATVASIVLASLAALIAIPGAPADQDRNPSIAVLPFENRSSNSDDQYVVDSIHDDVLTNLAGISGLEVASRTSVERFRNSMLPIRDIGAEIGVDAILEGGVQRSGDRIRVNIRLVDAVSERHIWANSFDEELTISNVFAIQSAIAESIARSLRVVMDSNGTTAFASPPTQSLPAYEAYQRGARLLRRRTGATIDAAILEFQKSVELDSQFSLPYVGLADAYQLSTSYSGADADAALASAHRAAVTAIELDPTAGPAYASLAMILFEAARQRVELDEDRDAEQLFTRSIELNPGNATAHQWYGEFLSSHARLDEALRRFRRALDIEPDSPIANHVYAHTLAAAGQPEEAEIHYWRAINSDPAFARAYQGLAVLYFSRLGRLADAGIAANQAVQLDPLSPSNYALLSNIYIHLGDENAAMFWLDRATEISSDNHMHRRVRTMLLVLRGEYESAEIEARKGLADYGHDRMLLSVVKNRLLELGEPEKAIELYEAAFPYFAVGRIDQVSESRLWAAVDYAGVLQSLSRQEDAERIIAVALGLVDKHFANQGNRFLVLRAAAFSVLGDEQQALKHLAMATRLGWHRNAFYHFDYDTNFDALRGHPEFQAIAKASRETSSRQLDELRSRIHSGATAAGVR